MAYTLIEDEAPKGYTLIEDAPKKKDSNIPRDVLAGLVRGAGSIGATLLTPLDAAARAVGIENSVIGRRDRREAMDAGLRELGADTDSLAFKGGKLGAEIAGTAGVGGALARGAGAFGASPGVVAALQSGGLSAPGAGMATRTGAAALTGGVSAGMVDPNDAALGAGISAALPGGVKLAGSAGSKLRDVISGGGVAPEVAALAQRAKDLGINIPADRLVNSRPLNALAGSLNYVPFAGRAATEDAMNSQLNRALSGTFGQNTDNVTKGLRDASATLGAEFDRVLSSTKVNVDNPFLNALANAYQRADKELGSDGARIIKSQIDEILAKADNGVIDGQAAYNIKKTLDRIGNRNSPEAFYAIDLKRDLMEALNRSLGGNEAMKFAKTRAQYGNMLALEKIAKNGAEGDVSVARLANMKNINNADLQELADIAAQFVKPREGAHSMQQRAMVGLGAGVLGGIPAMVGTGLAGRAANSALNSDAARRLLLNSPDLEQALVPWVSAGQRSLPGLLNVE